jgi:hypothetical protein
MVGQQSNDIIVFNPVFLVFGLLIFLASIATIIDVARYPSVAFKGTGTSKTGWIILQVIAMFFCGIGALIMCLRWWMGKKQAVIVRAASYGYRGGLMLSAPLPPPPGYGMAPGSFPRQAGYGEVPSGGYGSAPSGSKYAQPPADAPPPADSAPASPPPPSDWAPPPPPPGSSS